MDADTHILAITALEGSTDAQTAALAAALGVTAYDARQWTLPPPPRAVATRAGAAAAAARAARLAPAGFAPVVLRRGDIPGDDDRILVRSFVFRADGLHVETRTGAAHRVGYDGITRLVQGQDHRRETETRTSSRRKLALGKALATGGMIMTKTEKTTRTTIHETGGPFLVVYAAGSPALAFRESELQYQGLGAALQPGGAANFQTLIAELCARAGDATWNGQLMTAAGLRHVLGGVLSPERDLDVALALLARG